MPVWTRIEQNKSPMVRMLHAWWMTHRGPSGIPDRRDLDPAALRAVLPNLFISDVEPAPFRIRYRLVGTKAVRTIGFDITGRYLDELLTGQPEVPWLDHYRTVYDSREPLLGSVVVPAKSGGTFAYEFGLFPLTQGGTAVAQIAAVEDYFDFDLTAAQLIAQPPGSRGTGSSGEDR
ncbi:PAS domain-containing protein [Dongia sp.]|uniref:PAS domain-containing protein n=1 Tax=Dongia sp. TaxID=1977262 RepID=UPI003751AAE6